MCTWELVNSLSLFYKFLLNYAATFKKKKCAGDKAVIFPLRDNYCVCMCMCDTKTLQSFIKPGNPCKSK